MFDESASARLQRRIDSFLALRGRRRRRSNLSSEQWSTKVALESAIFYESHCEREDRRVPQLRLYEGAQLRDAGVVRRA